MKSTVIKENTFLDTDFPTFTAWKKNLDDLKRETRKHTSRKAGTPTAYLDTVELMACDADGVPDDRLEIDVSFTIKTIVDFAERCWACGLGASISFRYVPADNPKQFADDYGLYLDGAEYLDIEFLKAPATEPTDPDGSGSPAPNHDDVAFTLLAEAIVEAAGLGTDGERVATFIANGRRPTELRLSERGKAAFARALETENSPIPESEWEWYGNALHCIVSNRCRFHMATKVGDYIISTIGELQPRDNHESVEWEALGGAGNDGKGRTFETFIFPFEGKRDCGCPILGLQIESKEIVSRGYYDHVEARKGHMFTCKKIAGLSKA